MKKMFADLKLPLLLVALLCLCAALTVPIIPIDETRYVSVAWEMWNGHSFLVPYLNGQAYSHKPPLLFYLMHAGWALFGVNDFTPRLVPGIFSLLSLILTYKISLSLWPPERKTAAVAALVLAATSIWDTWSIAIMFDMVLTFWILLGLLGTLRAAGKQRGGWLMLTAGIAGGLLTKGPAVFIYLLSIPLFRFWWDTRKENPVRAKWYLGIACATVLGLLIALLWAIPAAMYGGEEYRHAILWGQTVGRVTSSFAHRRPFWWYLPILPIFFIPWIFFRPSFAKIQIKTADMGTRFCLIWLGLPLLIFSFISGKQVHYLLPFVPAGALLIGRNISRAEGLSGKTSVKIIGGFFLILGLATLAVPLVDFGGDVGRVEYGNTLFFTVGLFLAGGLLFLPFRSPARTSARLACCMELVLLFGLIESKKLFMDNFDMKETALFIKSQMDGGHPFAQLRKYYGQYQFLGRLQKPITQLKNDPDAISEFSAGHPGAMFISYLRENEVLPPGSKIRFSHKYRGRTLVIWQFENRP